MGTFWGSEVIFAHSQKFKRLFEGQNLVSHLMLGLGLGQSLESVGMVRVRLGDGHLLSMKVNKKIAT